MSTALFAPCAYAQSSISRSWFFRGIAVRSAGSAGCPKRCTATTALVRDVIRLLTETGSSVVGASISARTGVAPQRSIPTTVATAVCGDVITSSPGQISAPRRASSIASVPLATPMPSVTPVYGSELGLELALISENVCAALERNTIASSISLRCD